MLVQMMMVTFEQKKISRKKRVPKKKKKLISTGMPNKNMLQYVSKRQFQCVMMISSWPLILILSTSIDKCSVQCKGLRRVFASNWFDQMTRFQCICNFDPHIKSVLLMSDIFDDACYQIFANPHQDVNLWIYKSYLIWCYFSRLQYLVLILISFTTDLPNSEREELWRRRRTLHTSRHKVSLHDQDQYQNVDIWFQIDFLECSFDFIQINIKMLAFDLKLIS